jgi:hypothetical protein
VPDGLKEIPKKSAESAEDSPATPPAEAPYDLAGLFAFSPGDNFFFNLRGNEIKFHKFNFVLPKENFLTNRLFGHSDELLAAVRPEAETFSPAAVGGYYLFSLPRPAVVSITLRFTDKKLRVDWRFFWILLQGRKN